MDKYAQYCYNSLMETSDGRKFLDDLEYSGDLKPVSGKKDIKEDNNGRLCKFCGSLDIIERSVQTRSLDEGETLYTVCKTCKKVSF